MLQSSPCEAEAVGFGELIHFIVWLGEKMNRVIFLVAILAVAVLMPVDFVDAGVLFEDDFDRAVLGANWGVGGVGATASINGSQELELDGEGPVYYTTLVDTGVSGSSYTVEYTLTSLSDQTAGNYIGIVSFGNDLSGDRVQANYVTNGADTHSLFLQVYDNGTRVENYYTNAGVNLRQFSSHIVYEIVTDAGGISTIEFSAYEDATKSNVLFQTGPQILSTTVGAGYIGFSLPSNAYEGYSIDNVKISGVVPEPASMLLLAGGMGLLIPRRQGDGRSSG